MKKFLLLLATCAIFGGLNAAAGPLKPADIPENPAWVFHVDCDALRKTYLGGYLLYQANKPEFRSNLLAFQSIFSFDFRTQLHGISVYAPASAPQDRVALIYADFRTNPLAEIARTAGKTEVFTDREHSIYSWLDKSNRSPDGSEILDYAILQGDCAVLSTNRKTMLGEIDVLDGLAPHFSSAIAPAVAGDPDFFMAKATGFGFLGADPYSSLLKLCKRAKMQAAETDGELKATLTMQAEDAESAKLVSIVVQGFIAQLRLQKNTPQIARMADTVSVKQNSSEVTVTLAVQSKDLVAALKTYSAKEDKPKPVSP